MNSFFFGGEGNVNVRDLIRRFYQLKQKPRFLNLRRVCLRHVVFTRCAEKIDVLVFQL